MEIQRARLGIMTGRQRESVRQRDALARAADFDHAVTELALDRKGWLFYDVNVQGAFSFDTARQIIAQCNDSDLAFYWPIALELKHIDATESPSGQAAAPAQAKGDMHLTVKGQFVARK
ncbi:MAG: hypothetical protein HKP58_06180 [Desulfatitalea sp.]|nr:hypothetical protein [Desulfatitalea sp.]NNJ99984.1 hypothetical protein [Desulfatitalea sp.]